MGIFVYQGTVYRGLTVHLPEEQMLPESLHCCAAPVAPQGRLQVEEFVLDGQELLAWQCTRPREGGGRSVCH